MPCPSCSSDCLGLCRDVVCPDRLNCHGPGICDISDESCSYNAPSAQGSQCYRDAETDLPRGVCYHADCSGCADPITCMGCPEAGSCVDCIDHDDCMYPEGPMTCFLAECENNTCLYDVVDPSKICSIEHCIDGYIFAEKLCTQDGSCPPTKITFCGGLSCAPEGDRCVDSCANHYECIIGYYCDSYEVCILDETYPIAELSNLPEDYTTETSAVVTVSGLRIISYRYRLDGFLWSQEIPVKTAITLGGWGLENTPSMSLAKIQLEFGKT